jgi:uncharacterized protein
MGFSLYSATVPAYLQALGALAGLINKADAHCTAEGIAPVELIEARLAPDMFPFAYQVKSVKVHTLGAIQGVRKGLFNPDMTTPPDSFAAMRTLIDSATQELKGVSAEEVDSFLGRDMRFEYADTRMDFTAEDFLLSFSQPNFYFHLTTAYDLLRWKGVQIGKRDYMGRPRLKKP